MNLPKIPLDDIEVGTRFREDLGDLKGLAFDINKNGQITPIAICANTEGEEKPYRLLAGGRRLAAMRSLGRDTIICRIYDRIMSDLELRSIELAENFHRKDLNYGEDARIKLEIHRLQVAIHGEKITRDPNDKGWSKSDTARLLNISPATLSQDLKLQSAIEKMPELGLGDCKNKAEAMKRLGKLGTSLVREQKADEYQKNMGNVDARIQKVVNSFIIGDFFDRVKDIPSGTIDFVECDPPYAIKLEEIKKHYEYTGYNEMTEENYPDTMRAVLAECYRVMKKDSWMILWFAPEPWFEKIYQWIIDAGFNTNRMCGTWVKENGQSNQPTRGFANAYEMFFVIKKGSPLLAAPGATNVFPYNTVPPLKKVHPTEKPLALMRDIFKCFTQPGDSVLVPFAGSGVSIIAGHTLNVNTVGFDLSKEYKDAFTIKVHTDLTVAI